MKQYGVRLSRAADKRTEIRAAYETGLTLAACARLFGMSQATVTKAIRDAGGTTRPRGTKGRPS
jgi:AraC-like DNA-binding protein